MNKELEALEIECGELVEMDLLFLDRNGENQEKWHNSEAFKKAVEFEKKYGKSHTYILKSALQRLEAIDNANPSEAMKILETFENDGLLNKEIGTISYNQVWLKNQIEVLKQSSLKAQEQENENAELKSRIQDLEKDLEEQQELAKHYLEEQGKVLEIVKEKNVNVEQFMYSETIFDYNYYANKYIGGNCKLTEEEFDLLKRYFGNENI